ncbi:hypothetical protein AYO40_05860 [Planctomycetaceae bacterium SCGC AG-212-D15]|nr:hypothetical protein AYO40_05860 [Planctomycetaceae bacterium SCGC AG-212-D15]
MGEEHAYDGEGLEPPLIRRDSPPNRGGFLILLAVAGIAFALAGGIGLPVSIAVWIMASRDIRLLAQFQLDEDVREYTHTARVMGIVGTFLNAAIFCIAGGIAFLILLLSA